jgi:hypothetical protein
VDSTSCVSNSCPVCGSGDFIALTRIERAPVFCNVQWPTAKQAVAAETAEIELAFCTACSHVCNRGFDPARMEYSGAYENSLHFSDTFSTFADDLADRLVREYGLKQRKILEIGCGKGEVLTALCSRGDVSASADVEFFAEYFSAKHAGIEPDFLCCRHVLEHMADPVGFLTELRQSLGGRSGLPVYFEVPNGELTLTGDAVWDIIYEHPSYFSRHSLERTFAAAGYTVSRIGRAFSDRFLGVEATVAAAVAPVPRADGWELISEARAFADRYQARIAGWEARLAEVATQGRAAVLWGAGSKGVSFLHAVAGARLDVVPAVVDINIHKQGKFMPGTGQEIVAPDDLAAIDPAVVIVMNSAYAGEIRAALGAAGMAPEVVCA